MINPLEMFWRCSQEMKPVFSYDQVMDIPKSDRDVLISAGLLKEFQISETVECEACDAGHVEKVESIEYEEGMRRYFIACPEVTRVEVEPNRLRQWLLDFSTFAVNLSGILECFDQIKEILPNKLWFLGKTAVSGNLQSIWVASHLDREVLVALPEHDKTTLLLLGQVPPCDLGLEPERVISVGRLFYIDIDEGELKFNSVPLLRNLKALANTLPQLPENIFRRKGSLWQVRFDGGDEFLLSAMKGADNLCQLLKSQGEYINVLKAIAGAKTDLSTHIITMHEALDTGLTISDDTLLASVDPKLDWEAVKSYRAEIIRLKTDKEERKRTISETEAFKIEELIEKYQAQINDAIGIGGKLKSAENKLKNARDGFRNNAKRAIAEIEKADSKLAEHLTQSITYGNDSRYLPKHCIDWEIEPILS